MDAPSEFHKFCSQARESGYNLLYDCANMAFRNLFDPYCSEYWKDERKLDAVRLLNKIGISLVPLAQAFRLHWREQNREDISISCVDGLAMIAEEAIKHWE
jgi:hypothetical protein